MLEEGRLFESPLPTRSNTPDTESGNRHAPAVPRCVSPALYRLYSELTPTGDKVMRHSLVKGFDRQLSLDRSGSQEQGGAVPTSDFGPAVLATEDFGPVRGRGSFGTIYRVPLISRNGCLPVWCAVKVFRPTAKCEAENEIAVCEEIFHRLFHRLGTSHPNIVRYFGSTERSHASGQSEIVMAMEWIEGPTVQQVLKNAQTLNPEEKIALAKWAGREALLGLKALEEIGYSHNDIKPDNMMIDLERRTVKLMDFSNAAPHYSRKPVGNPLYSGPERMKELGRSPDTPLGPDELLYAIGEQLGQRERDFAKLHESRKGGPVSPVHLAVDEALRLSLPENIKKSDLARKYKNNEPVGTKTDSYGMGQILHQIVEGKFYTPLDIDWHARQDVMDAQGIQLGTAMAFEELEKRGMVFSPEQQSDALKKDAGYYDFINHAMDPDREKRWTPSMLLAHPFLNESFPSEEQIDTLIQKIIASGSGK